MRSSQSLASALLVVIAIGLLGGVHPIPKLGLALAAAAMGLWAVLGARDRSGPATLTCAVGALPVLAVMGAAGAVVVVGPEGRAALQPGYAPLVDASLAVAGEQRHPLALDPHRGLWAWAVGAATLVFGLGAASVLGSARRARLAVLVLVGCGVGLVLLEGAQRLTEASSILWVTGHGGGRGMPFFGTLVNANHGGILCAVLVPLALALGWGRPLDRAPAWGAAALLALGTVASGSRGAVVLALLATAVYLVLLAGPLVRRAAGALVGLSAVAVLLVGPREAFLKLTLLLRPSFYSRGDLWSHRADIYAEAGGLLPAAPWTGAGPGGFRDAYLGAKQFPVFATVSHAHLDPLQALVEHGIPLTALWTLAIVAVLLLGVRRLTRGAQPLPARLLAGGLAGLTALLVATLFDFPLRIPALALLGALLGGMVLALATRGQPPAPAALQKAWRGAGLGLAALAVAALVSALVLRDRTDSYFGDASRTLFAAEQAWTAGDRSGAEALLRRSLRQRPLNPDALLRLARARLVDGDVDEARHLLQLATRVAPSHPYPWLNLARLERQEGRAEAEREAWRRLLAVNAPDNDRVEPWLAEALLHGDEEPLVLAYDVLPERPDRWCRAAALLARHGEPASAEILFFAAIQQEPECAVAYGAALVGWGRPAEALVAVEPFEEGCGPWRTRAHALLALDRPRPALEAFDEALRTCVDPDPLLRFGLARARLATGDPSGLAILERLAEEQPEELAFRRALVRELVDRGKHGAAVGHLEDLVQAGLASTADEAELQRLRQVARPPMRPLRFNPAQRTE